MCQPTATTIDQITGHFSGCDRRIVGTCGCGMDLCSCNEAYPGSIHCDECMGHCEGCQDSFLRASMTDEGYCKGCVRDADDEVKAAADEVKALREALADALAGLAESKAARKALGQKRGK